MVKIQVSFQGLGWKVLLQQKRTNYFLTLVKEIVLGNALKRGDELYYYLVECNKRKGILIFLDGKGRPGEDLIKLKGQSFLISSK
ncbi:hypothetical protein KY338_04095 [Candidatus Woesearchaeota archaeon]|nr:hypothetical protein [Candidatus Woesearchaeota archaeon]MBW3005495.1 hypothetical protein [Candidatus Woesearchaeota archaeon]